MNPSIGLHHKDNARLLATLQELRDLGNTVVVVEHDEETIRRADYVIDLGPGAGTEGGNVVAAGKPDIIAANEDSLTAKYLSGRLQIAVPSKRRSANHKAIVIRGASEHNLRNIDVSFPIGLMTVGHRSLGFRQVHACERDSVSRTRPQSLPCARRARRSRSH
jgi:excinuclease ABC subunit A